MVSVLTWSNLDNLVGEKEQLFEDISLPSEAVWLSLFAVCKGVGENL